MTDTVRGVCRRNRFLLSGICGATLACAGLPAAQADDVDVMQGKGNISFGTFTNNSEMEIRVDGEGDLGTVVDWGKTFGDKDKTRFRLDGLWRFNPRHHLRMMYTDYSRDESATIDQDIEWQGETIPASATVRSHFSFSIIEAAYEYGFISNEKYELAASAGLHWTTLDAALKATIDLGGGGGTVEVGGPATADLPLPVFGVRGMARLGGSDFYLDGQVQYFALSFDNVDGSILNYRAAVTWQPRKWVGIGIGFDSFNVDADVEKSHFSGSMDWTYSGPQVFYNVSF